MEASRSKGGGRQRPCGCPGARWAPQKPAAAPKAGAQRRRGL